MKKLGVCFLIALVASVIVALVYFFRPKYLVFIVGDNAEKSSEERLAQPSNDDGRPRRPNGINDVDRKNLPELWSSPNVTEHILKRTDGGGDIVFVECPPGEFEMGFRPEKGNPFTKHKVRLTYPFWISKTQLTHGQCWIPGVCNTDKGSRWGHHSCSVEQMAAMLKYFNEKYASQIPQGYVIRFPTFAEYQYAYRANSTDSNDPYTHCQFEGEERKRVCFDNETRKGWNGNRRTWPRVWPAQVGLLEPNAWGLYDMVGNGFTYLCDRINPDLSGESHYEYKDLEVDPIIYEEDAGRMLMRGGDSPDWIYSDFFCTWRWAFTYRLVVGPDLEKKGREQALRKNASQYSAMISEMKKMLPKRKIGPANALKQRDIEIFSGCTLKFVECPSGIFTMGHEVSEGPFCLREVKISRPFYMATTRMTMGAWFKYLEITGQPISAELRKSAQRRGGDDSALCGISAEDWRKFLMWLNARHGKSRRGLVFRLPTEAEWEYAYRAGSNRVNDPFAWTVPIRGGQKYKVSDYAYMEDERRKDFIAYGNGDIVNTCWAAYTTDWKRKALVPPGIVGKKKANAWGIKDMIGNGREWVLDRFSCTRGKFPAKEYSQKRKMVDPVFGYELDNWDCQMCRGGDDGYAERKCWDDNGSGWDEDTHYPTGNFCFRLVFGPDLIAEKRSGVKTAEESTGGKNTEVSRIDKTVKRDRAELKKVCDTKGITHCWRFNGSLTDCVTALSATATGGARLKEKIVEYEERQSNVILGEGLLPIGDTDITIELWVSTKRINGADRMFMFGRDGSNRLVSVWNWKGEDMLEAIYNGNHCVLRPCFGPFELDVEYHLALVLERRKNDGWEATAYKQNAKTGKTITKRRVEIKNGWSPNAFNHKDSWLGGSYWGDGTSLASYNEVRIWNRALSEEELTKNAIKFYKAGETMKK